MTLAKAFISADWLGRSRAKLVVVVVLAVAYTVLLATVSIRTHCGLKTQMKDLGNADRSIWGAANGDWSMTQYNFKRTEPRSRLAGHANLIFWPISLLYRIWSDPIVLLILTTFACTAAGLGLYCLSRHYLGNTWWICVPPAAFYMSPLVHDANLYDFHVITLATAFVVWSVYAFTIKKKAWAWALLVLAMLCKEDVALVTAMLGLHFIVTKERKTGILVLAASVAYFLIVNGVVTPQFNKGQLSESLSTSGSANRWDWILEKPQAILGVLFRPDRLRLPLYLLLSGAIAAWRGKSFLLLVLPHLGIGMLSDTVWMTRITGTYYW